MKEGRIKAAEFGQGIDDAMKKTLEGTNISADQLQKWGQSVAKGGKEGSAAMVEIATALTKVEDETKRNELGVKLFGTMYEDQGQNITNTLIDAQQKTIDFKNNQDQLNESVKKMDASPAVKMQQAFADLKVALEPVLEVVANAVSAFADWISKNPELAATLAAIATAIGIIAGAFIALAPIVITITSISAAMLGWIVVIPLIIAAVVGLVVAIVKNWDSIKEWTINIWNSIVEFLVNLWNGIVQTLSNVWNAITQTTMTVWTAIKEFFIGIWNGIVAFLTPILQGIADFFTTIWNGISTVVQAVWGFITQYLQAIWTAILYFVTPIFESIKNFITQTWDTISSTTSAVWDAIVGFLKGVWDSIVSVAKPIFDSIKDVIVNVWNWISDTSSNIWGGISSFLSGIWEGIKSTASSIWDGLKEAIMGPVRWVTGAVSGAFEGMKSAILGVWDGIKSGIKVAINGIIKMINVFIDGFNTPADALNKIPGVDAPKIPHIPLLAKGGHVAGDGSFIVGEAGPELFTKKGNQVSVTPLSANEKMQGISGTLSNIVANMGRTMSAATNTLQGASSISTSTQSSAVTHVSMADLFRGASIVIREEADLKKLAIELNNIITGAGRRV